MRKSIFIFIIVLLQIDFVYAHVGNSNTTLEGMAGPYHVLINIKAPDVIPGTATLTLFTSNDPQIKIYARPIYFYSGENGAPAPDLLTPVSESPGQYEGTLWLMNNGSASIELIITGPLGTGKMVVPVVAVSTATQKLPPATAYMLIVLGIFLFILMVTIIGSSVADGITKIGEPVSARSKYLRKIAYGVTAVLCFGLVYGGYAWWQSVAKRTSEYIFKPMHINYRLNGNGDVNELHLTIDTANSQRSQLLPYIIPDHGKIMHLFIISLPGMDFFAHIHPERVGPVNFITGIPKLPGGKYLAFADIVYNSGFTETLKDTLTISDQLSDNAEIDSVKPDPDDAFDFSHPLNPDNTSLKGSTNITIGGYTGEAVKMKDGTIILMQALKNNKNYLNNQLYPLQFSVWDKNYQPITPDLYMGMQGHAVIVRSDGMVFSHVHPVGTYSMAAQTTLLDRINLSENIYKDPNDTGFRDSIDRAIKSLQGMPEKEREDYLMKEMNMPGSTSAGTGDSNSMHGMNMRNMHATHKSSNDAAMAMDMNAGNTVSFPYNFPSPGRYRIWVQLKKDGTIYTAVFDRDVK